ncbi:MAG: SPFH/Band 7/PHB domain protein, partial [Haloferacaceae archaeon]
YGKSLTGSDAQEMEGLEGREFDAETRELLGLDDIESALEELDELEVGGTSGGVPTLEDETAVAEEDVVTEIDRS